MVENNGKVMVNTHMHILTRWLISHFISLLMGDLTSHSAKFHSSLFEYICVVCQCKNNYIRTDIKY